MFMYALPTATTSFVGRTEELASIAALLADPQCRLLTLLGPGGIGKTRLALQAAADQFPYFAHGVTFVPLNSVASPNLIASAVAGALELPFYGADEIIRYLREKQLLLVLDNFDHLLDGSNLLAEILQAAPAIKLLITSRERLNLMEEWVIALEGLRTPNGSAEPLESYSAVQLFVQRARQMHVNFSLSENEEAVKTICQCVEGMPLGLELAASWLRVMSCAQIAAQIEASLDFLTTSLRNVPERHRSLRAIFEQSWNLLSTAEKDGLMRVSIFRGGFDREAAAYVADASLPLLAGLADKSLIRVNMDGRYDLHELLRQYASEKLTEAGETSAAADQHLRYFVALAEQAEAHVWGRDQQAWYDRLEAELDNLRAALTWSLEGGQAEMGLRLASALGWLFIERFRPSEGLLWLERMLAVNEEASASLRAKALNRAGEIAGLLSDGERARILGEQALALARSVNDRLNMAWALSTLGYYPHIRKYPDPSEVAQLEQSLALFRELEDTMGLNHALRRRAQMGLEQKNYPYVRLLLEEALAGARESGDQNAIAQTQLTMGDIIWRQTGDLVLATQQYESGLALFRELRNQLGIIYALDDLANIRLLTGNKPQAQTLYREALTLIREFAPNSNPLEQTVLGLASVASTSGKLERAARLFGATDVIKYLVSSDFPMMVLFENDLVALRAQMGEATFAEAWAAGKAMTREQIITYALQEDDALEAAVPTEQREDEPPRPDAHQSLIDPLSKRELEILRLVAAGRSNREIAAELFLALGTVKWYLNTINSKLGVTSRTQAVARAYELDLIL